MQEINISRRLAALALVALFSFSFFFVTSAANGIAPNNEWTTRTVDAADVYSSSLAIDHNDRIHIAYYDYGSGLRYATNSAPYGNWSTTGIDSMSYFGAKLAMALDGNNKAHISYYDGLSKELRYAQNTGGSFVTRVIDQNGVFDSVGNDIAVDSANRAHVSYVIADHLKYATDKTGSWNITTLPENLTVIYPTKIAIGSGDIVHIIYQSYRYTAANSTAHYMINHTWNAGGVWNVETIVSYNAQGLSSIVHTECALTMDSFNQPTFIYALRDTVAPFKTHLMYTFRGPSGWSTPYEFVPAVDQVREQMSLVTDNLNAVHITFCDGQGLRYATNAGGWGEQNITIGSFKYPSIGMDTAGKLYVAYGDPGQSAGAFHLKYVTTARLPSEPWNLRLSPAPSSLVLQWDPPNSTGDYYRNGYCLYLYNSDPSFGAVPIKTVALPSTDSTYTFTGLLWNGGPYFVSMVAASSAGYSNTSSVMTGSPADLPTAPSLTGYEKLTGVNLTWTAPIYSNGSAVTNYSIAWGTSTSAMTSEIVLGDVLTYEQLSLSPGNYYYKVHAKNIIGWGPYSPTVLVVVHAQIPTPPLNLVAVGGDGRVTLTWDPPSSNGGSSITRFDIYRGTTSEGIATISYAHVTGTTFTYIDTSVTNGQKYYYLVIASNGQGAGTPSLIVSATPEGTSPPPEGTDSNMTTILVIAVVVVIAIIAMAYYFMSRRGGGSP